MTESKEKEKAIAVTAGYVLGLALNGAMVIYFAGSAFRAGWIQDWGTVIVDTLFLAISLYYSFKLSNRIAERVEK